MSSTVSSLVVVDIGAWFSGVEMEGDVKDDTWHLAAGWRQRLHRKSPVEYKSLFYVDWPN